MSIKNIDIKDKKDTLEVHVSLNERNDRKKSFKMRFDTSDVLKFLNKEKISYGKCIQEKTLKNWHSSLLDGVWVFKKKTLDKPEKQVILKEEKPKTTRKRRTKKVSTEE